MTFDEYRNRLLEIRRSVNRLIDDLGGTHGNAPMMLEKVLNIAMNGDFAATNGDKVRTRKIITVSDFRNESPRDTINKSIYL